jgi:hypothetical protein
MAPAEVVIFDCLHKLIEQIAPPVNVANRIDPLPIRDSGERPLWLRSGPKYLANGI